LGADASANPKIRPDVLDLSDRMRDKGATEGESAMIRDPFGTNARILPIRAKCLRPDVAEVKIWTKRRASGAQNEF
jgi:hypothetical protein